MGPTINHTVLESLKFHCLIACFFLQMMIFDKNSKIREGDQLTLKVEKREGHKRR